LVIREMSRKVLPYPLTNSQKFLAWGAYLLGRWVPRTIRMRLEDRSGLVQRGKLPQAIYCMWHNRLALALTAYYRFAKPITPARGLAVMVSASRDGTLLAAVLERFGVVPVRGSSSRRGEQALLELVGWAERGYDLGITPDGPRGPRYEIQDGVLWLAQLTGLPIFPCSYDVRWHIRVKSWDRFIIPLPFSTCVFRVGPPIRLPRVITLDEFEKIREDLKGLMMSLGAE
jgi:lysophospholipid acyltransferase (LPLAT)-like uncharacterized protein